MKRYLTWLLILALALPLAGCAKSGGQEDAQNTAEDAQNTQEDAQTAQSDSDTPAIRVNGETYSVADLAYYYYGTRSSMMGSGYANIDGSKSMREQTYLDGTQTWYDYLVSTASSLIAQTVVTVRAAEDAGFDGGGEVEESVRSVLDRLTELAAESGSAEEEYLRLIYGPLMTVETFERNLRLSMLADAYDESLAAVENYSEAELEAACAESPAQYELVSYEYLLIYNSGSEDGGVDAAALAEDALGRVSAGEAPEAVAEELDATYASSSVYYDSASGELGEWLFDDARRDGDATKVDLGYGCIVAVFRGRERADFHPVDVRHILVADEAAANGLLARFNAGDKTEDSFAALAKENSTDPGSAENGGLYTGVYKGQMVKPFEEWCFAARRPGDVGIVQTDYGYHVMYYVGESERAYWQTLAAKTLRDKKVAALTEGAETELLEGGLAYLDPIA